MVEFPAEEIRIIEFGEEDAEEISQLFKEVWPSADEYPKDWRKKRIYSPDQIIDEMQNGYHYFGGRLQGKIVGLYKVTFTDKGLYGEHQTVSQACWGTGLASAMYIQFAEYGKQHNCVRNYCNILVDSETGKKLMKKFGFRKWGEPYEQYPGMMVQLYERLL